MGEPIERPIHQHLTERQENIKELTMNALTLLNDLTCGGEIWVSGEGETWMRMANSRSYKVSKRRMNELIHAGWVKFIPFLGTEIFVITKAGRNAFK